MDSEGILEQFRENWQHELLSKSGSNCDEGEQSTVEKAKATEDSKYQNTADKQSAFSSFDNATVDCANSDSADLCECLCTGSCSISGIKSSCKDCINCSQKVDNMPIVTMRRTQKRKGKEKKQNNKVSKCSRFDDIFTEKETGVLPQERLLDRLIQDIDEITAIPFFDISIPKEVAINIFQYLGIKDLCSCAQVSKSWKTLSEDELIWCRICHSLGRETIYTTREKQNWKQIVQHNIERQRSLVANWKERTGKLSQLEHVRGKILCSVHSHNETVVAGYTNGDVKYWDVATGDSCVFRPSNTSLSIAENYDVGTERNIVQSVVTSDNITAALYSQGNVDIWSVQAGSDPFQTYSPSTRQFPVTSLCLSKNSNTVVTKYGPYLDVLYGGLSEEDFCVYTHLDTGTEIRSIKLQEDDRDVSSVLFSKYDTVSIFCPKQPDHLTTVHVPKDLIGQSGQVTEIHNIADVPVSVFDVRVSPAVLAVAVGSYMSGTGGDWFKVHIYDIQSGKLIQSLRSHSPGEGPATMTSCLNLAESPPNEMITASADRKLRIYDLRQANPVQTFENHPHKVTCIQMDEWKVISGGDDGYIYGSVYFWDRRMGKQLWHLTNRHPVQYCHFEDKHLIFGNIPTNKFPQNEDFEVASHSRYRGSIQVYDFLEDLTTQDVPEICLSTYDQPGASKYNIALAMPYDVLNY